MCFFSSKYESFDNVRYAITLVGRCHESPDGNLIMELMPGVFALCFGTPKRNQFLRFRKQYQIWSNQVIEQYCTSGFAGYPEEAIESIFALDHGCAVAMHQYREQPMGRHVVNSMSTGLQSMASDLTQQAMTGRWPQ